jgi:hypothetical protein
MEKLTSLQISDSVRDHLIAARNACTAAEQEYLSQAIDVSQIAICPMNETLEMQTVPASVCLSLKKLIFRVADQTTDDFNMTARGVVALPV